MSSGLNEDKDGAGGPHDEAAASRQRQLANLALLVETTESLLHTPLQVQNLQPEVTAAHRAQQDAVWTWLEGLPPHARAYALTWTNKRCVQLLVRMHKALEAKGQGFFHLLTDGGGAFGGAAALRRQSSLRSRRKAHPTR